MWFVEQLLLLRMSAWEGRGAESITYLQYKEFTTQLEYWGAFLGAFVLNEVNW